MIKARIDQLDRDDETTQNVGDGAMRIDVGAKFVSAKKRVPREERIAFTFEIQILRQPDHFVAVFLHPAREMRRFAGAFFVPEITRD